MDPTMKDNSGISRFLLLIFPAVFLICLVHLS